MPIPHEAVMMHSEGITVLVSPWSLGILAVSRECGEKDRKGGE